MAALQMNSFHQDRVSAAVWPWSSPQPAPPDNSRRKGLLQAIVAGAGAVFVGFAFRHPWASAGLGAVAIWFLVSGLFWPRGYRAVDRWLSRLARAVGTVVTGVLLVPFFYLCFVPGRLLLWLLHKDPLHRRLRTDEPTYWTRHPRPTSLDQFRKPY